MIWILSFFILFMSCTIPAFGTTVAWDGKTVAADSQRTINEDVVFPDDRPKIHKIRGYVVGCSGLIEQGNDFVKWFRKGRPVNEEPNLNSDFMALVVNGKSAVFYHGGCKPYHCTAPWAIGCGRNFALGAMAAGASARKAVEISSKYDIHTGGKITEIKTWPRE